VKYALSIACGASSVWEKMAHGDTIGPPNPSFLHSLGAPTVESNYLFLDLELNTAVVNCIYLSVY